MLAGKSSLAHHWHMPDLFEAIAAPTPRAVLDELHERDGQTLFELREIGDGNWRRLSQPAIT